MEGRNLVDAEHPGGYLEFGGGLRQRSRYLCGVKVQLLADAA